MSILRNSYLILVTAKMEMRENGFDEWGESGDGYGEYTSQDGYGYLVWWVWKTQIDKGNKYEGHGCHE